MSKKKYSLKAIKIRYYQLQNLTKKNLGNEMKCRWKSPYNTWLPCDMTSDTKDQRNVRCRMSEQQMTSCRKHFWGNAEKRRHGRLGWGEFTKMCSITQVSKNVCFLYFLGLVNRSFFNYDLAILVYLLFQSYSFMKCEERSNLITWKEIRKKYCHQFDCDC